MAVHSNANGDRGQGSPTDGRGSNGTMSPPTSCPFAAIAAVLDQEGSESEEELDKPQQNGNNRSFGGRRSNHRPGPEEPTTGLSNSRKSPASDVGAGGSSDGSGAHPHSFSQREHRDPGRQGSGRPRRKSLSLANLDQYAIAEGVPMKQSELEQGMHNDMPSLARTGSPALDRSGSPVSSGSNDQPNSNGSYDRRSSVIAFGGSFHNNLAGTGGTCPVSGHMGAGSEHDSHHHNAIHFPKTTHTAMSSAASVRSGTSQSKASFARSGRNSMHSASKNSALRKRRSKRRGQGNTFTEEESNMYAPALKESWALVLQRASDEEFGQVFFEEMMDIFGDGVHEFLDEDAMKTAPKLTEMVKQIVACVDSVQNLYHKLLKTAAIHVQRGVRSEMVPKFGQVLFAAIRRVLQEEWTEEVQNSWEWLWNWLGRMMESALEDAKYGVSLLTRSWDRARENYPNEDIGNLFFDTLFGEFPNLKAVYHQSRQILACKFAEMLATLVSLHGDPQRLEDTTITLGIRHVAYNAQAKHTKIFGDVLAKTMEKAVGTEWTEELSVEWQDLWHEACKAMFSVMEDAQEHSGIIEELWTQVQQRTTPMRFGTALRRRLLEGFEWVANLHKKIKESESISKPFKSPGPQLNAVVNTRGAKNFETQSNSSGDPETGAAVAAMPLFAAPPPQLELRRPASSWARATSAITSLGGLRNSTSASHDHFLSVGHDEHHVGDEKAGDGDAIGQQFWEFLQETIELMWEPEVQNEHIMVKTKEFYKKGIRSEHVPTIGNAIKSTMQYFMGTAWSDKETEAFDWLWKIVGRTMTNTLKMSENDDQVVLQASWSMVKERVTTEEFGEIIFNNLAHIEPGIIHLFRRPKRIQAAQFEKAVEMLIEFASDPENFFLSFKGLVIRHIKYGVKVEHTKPFGQAILVGIQSILKNDWDERTAGVWNNLWLRASTYISRALSVGTNPVIVSLVQGDVEKLKSAIRCAPRIERPHWLTEVDVNGKKLSPIAWAIRDRNFDLVDFMVNDLLTIRADRETYYYGREVLFEAHPDIVHMFCKECPQMLDTLLDGLMWHSQFVQAEDGKVRVNYFIKDIYGDPQKNPDAWHTSLAVLVEKGSPKMFLHPTVLKVLELKWKGFCSRWFLLMQAWYLIMQLLLMVANIVRMGDCSLVPLRIFLAVASALTCCFQVAICMTQVRRGQSSLVKLPRGIVLPLPRWLNSAWNWLRFLACLLMPFSALVEPCQFAHGTVDAEPDKVDEVDSITFAGRSITAFVCMMLWIQSMQTLVYSTRLAALTWNLEVMFQDVSRNLVVVLFFMFSWASALTALVDTDFEDYGEGLVVLLRDFLRLSPPDHKGMHPLSSFFLFTFAIVTTSGMYAILVAQIRSSYEVVARDKMGFAMQHRASICIDIESILPLSMRQKIFDSLNFDKPCPFDSGDEGPSGGLQVLEEAHVRNHAKYVADRIQRYTGEASPYDPWEEDDEEVPIEHDDDYINRD